MTGTLRIALSQLDAVVGDIPGNEAKIRDGLRRARSAGAQIVLFPELAVTGYPPEDLLLKEHFLADARVVARVEERDSREGAESGQHDDREDQTEPLHRAPKARTTRGR